MIREESYFHLVAILFAKKKKKKKPTKGPWT